MQSLRTLLSAAVLICCTTNPIFAAWDYHDSDFEDSSQRAPVATSQACYFTDYFLKTLNDYRAGRGSDQEFAPQWALERIGINESIFKAGFDVVVKYLEMEIQERNDAKHPLNKTLGYSTSSLKKIGYTTKEFNNVHEVVFKLMVIISLGEHPEDHVKTSPLAARLLASHLLEDAQCDLIE